MAHINKVSVRHPLKTVAIVVPLSNKKELTPDEEISLKHLIHFLGKYDKYMVAPKSLAAEYPGFEIKRFSDRLFGSLEAHKKLSFSPGFYKAFREYKYILMYHLDALVLSDQLMEWCETDLDYIGPPWITCDDAPWVRVPRVGNSGFSLRKIESFLKVIYSPIYSIDPREYWERFCRSNPRYIQYLNIPRKYLKYVRMLNGARWHMSRWKENDDFFWSDEARKYYPEFKIASFETGLRFGFELAPRLCFEMNNRRLPFGCHAWQRYDREFWEPYLLK